MDQGGRISLIRVARIIVESAMVYTLQLLIIIVLNFRHNNGQYVVQCAIVPSIGESISPPLSTPHVLRKEHQVALPTQRVYLCYKCSCRVLRPLTFSCSKVIPCQY